MESIIFQYFLPLILSIVRYFFLCGIPFILFYVVYKKAFAKCKIQAKLASKQDFIREIAYSMQTSLILAAMAVLVLKTPISQYTQLYTNLSDYPIMWIPLSVVLTYFVHDTYFYWMHRAIHHPKLFRRVHSVHHKSMNPSPWASYSFHFFEAILEGLIIPLILVLIPIHTVAIALFALSNFAINVYGHLGYEIVPKWFRHSIFFQILNTSIYHNLHHTRFDKNYGLYFRFWDRIMKTENPEYVAKFDQIQENRFGSTTPSKAV
jgi:lathosterol oxidase